jgi:hypothetical protein
MKEGEQEKEQDKDEKIKKNEEKKEGRVEKMFPSLNTTMKMTFYLFFLSFHSTPIISIIHLPSLHFFSLSFFGEFESIIRSWISFDLIPSIFKEIQPLTEKRLRQES